MMKTLIGVVGFLWLSLSLLPAQQDRSPDTYRHELSLSTVGIYQSSLIQGQVGFHPRLLYRYHWSPRFALRVQADLGRYRRVLAPNDLIQHQTSALMLGLEYRWQIGRLSIVPFLDLGYRSYEYLWNPSFGEDNAVDYDFARNRGISGRTGLGLYYQLSPRWRLGLESSYSYTYGQGYDTRDIPLGCDSCGHLRTFYWHGRGSFSPLSAVWLSYSFGAR